MAEFVRTPEDAVHEWLVRNDHAVIAKVAGEDNYHLYAVEDLEVGRVGGARADLEGLVDLVDAAGDAIAATWDQPPAETEGYPEDALTLAAECLSGGFVFAETAEGHDFWDGFRNALMVASAYMHQSSWAYPEDYDQTDAGDPFAHAANVMFNGFPWDETEEGYTYWAEIEEMLHELSLGDLPSWPAPPVPEPYSECDACSGEPGLDMCEACPPAPEQLELFPELTDQGFDFEKSAEEAVELTQNAIEAVIREYGEIPDEVVFEFETPHGLLIVEGTRVA